MAGLHPDSATTVPPDRSQRQGSSQRFSELRSMDHSRQYNGDIYHTSTHYHDNHTRLSQRSFQDLGNEPQQEELYRRLLDASIKNYPKQLHRLIDRGIDIDHKFRHDLTAMHHAAFYGQRAVVDLLVDQGANHNHQSYLCGTPLCMAIIKRKPEVVQTLLDWNASVTPETLGIGTALHCASWTGDLQTVSMLLANQADVGSKHQISEDRLEALSQQKDSSAFDEQLIDTDSSLMILCQPLALAVLRNNVKVAQLLLESRSFLEEECVWTGPRNVDPRNGDQGPRKATPIIIAAGRGFNDILDLLIYFGADINKFDDKGRCVLAIAAKNGHSSCVRSLLRNGAIKDKRDRYGDTALHLAVVGGHYDCVKAFRDEAADMNFNLLGAQRHSPLRLAAQQGDVRIAEILLDAGATVDSQNSAGSSLLMVAFENGHEDVYNLLLSRGAVMPTPKRGASSLVHSALSHAPAKALSMLQTLLKSSSHYRVPDNDIRDILDALKHKSLTKDSMEERLASIVVAAARGGGENTIKALRALGVDLDSRFSDGQTALHRVAHMRDYTASTRLLQLKADVNVSDNSGVTPLMSAIQTRQVRMVEEMIVDHGAAVNERNKTGRGPIHLAVQHNAIDILAILLRHDVEISAQEKRLGETPLHLAANNDNIVIARMLLEHNASITTRNTRGETPRDVAVACCHHDLAEFLFRCEKPNRAEVLEDEANVAFSTAKAAALHTQDSNTFEIAQASPVSLGEDVSASHFIHAAYTDHSPWESGKKRASPGQPATSYDPIHPLLSAQEDYREQMTMTPSKHNDHSYSAVRRDASEVDYDTVYDEQPLTPPRRGVYSDYHGIGEQYSASPPDVYAFDQARNEEHQSASTRRDYSLREAGDGSTSGRRGYSFNEAGVHGQSRSVSRRDVLTRPSAAESSSSLTRPQAEGSALPATPVRRPVPIAPQPNVEDGHDLVDLHSSAELLPDIQGARSPLTTPSIVVEDTSARPRDTPRDNGPKSSLSLESIPQTPTREVSARSITQDITVQGGSGAAEETKIEASGQNQGDASLREPLLTLQDVAQAASTSELPSDEISSEDDGERTLAGDNDLADNEISQASPEVKPVVPITSAAKELKTLLDSGVTDLEKHFLDSREEHGTGWAAVCFEGFDFAWTDQVYRTVLHLAALLRDCSLAEQIFDFALGAGADPGALDFANNTPFHHAAEKGDVSIGKKLLKFGALPTASNCRQRTPLQIAAEEDNQTFLKLLLKDVRCRETVNFQDDRKNTALHAASMNGSVEGIIALLDAGADSSITNDQDRNGVYYCDVELEDFVQRLIDEQLDLSDAGRQSADTIRSTSLESHIEASSVVEPCRCEICRIHAIASKLKDRDGVSVLDCPCIVHYKLLATRMFSTGGLLSLELESCDCDKCVEAKEKSDDLNPPPSNCACAKCLAKSGKRVSPRIALQDPSTFSHSVYCDGERCSQRKPREYLQGVRYKCDVCYDADFCESCHVLHDSDHTFRKFDVVQSLKYDRVISDKLEAACNCARCAQPSKAHDYLRQAGFVGTKKDYRRDPAPAWSHVMDICELESEKELLHDLVTLLIDNNAAVDTKDKKGTLLHRAASTGNIAIANLLVKRGAGVNIQISKVLASDYLYTPLKYAVQAGNPAMVRLLLRSGANVNGMDLADQTALHNVLENWYELAGILPLLLEHGASTSCVDSRKNTPLMTAVREDLVEAFEVFIDAGIDLTTAGVMDFAIQLNKHETVVALAKAGVKIRESVDKTLLFAARNGAGQVIASLLEMTGHTDEAYENDAEVDKDSSYGSSTSTAAKSEGDISLSRSTSVTNPASRRKGYTASDYDVNANDFNGLTALHHIANASAPEIDACLVDLMEAGANINARDDRGNTPLHAAARACSTYMVVTLLADGVDEDIKNYEGKTALDIALSKRHKEIVEMLGGKLKKKWYRRD